MLEAIGKRCSTVEQTERARQGSSAAQTAERHLAEHRVRHAHRLTDAERAACCPRVIVSGAETIHSGETRAERDPEIDAHQLRPDRSPFPRAR